MNRAAAPTSRAGLSLEQAPPLSVPLRFFLTAPPFAMLAGLALLWLGPETLASRWAPQTIGLTHLLTLGFITMVAIGAMLQMLPVLSGVAAPQPRLVAAWVHLLLLLGTLGLCGGFVIDPLFLRLGAALLGVAFAAFLALMALTFVRLRGSANPTVRGMRLALVGLAAAALLGLGRGTAYAWGVEVPVTLIHVHVAWALLGWIGLLVVAVAFQVVPMFQVTPDYPRAVRRWLVSGLFLSLLGWSVGALMHWTWLEKFFELVLVAGFCGFAITTLRLQLRRRRRITDAFLWFWRLGLGSILAAGALRLAISWGGDAGRLDILFGVLVIVGAVQSIMLGMLYKIVPFLVWLHSRNAPGGVHNMSQVLPERRARHQLRLHGLSLALLVAAILYPLVSPVAGIVFAGSSLWLAFNLIQAIRAPTAARAR
ncbi:MAG: hypothetical protein GWN84_18770 [Gammaproteobacteria bacterium]|nr:hypothetical protein [Gammaproteobacteria bacterium]NIR84869.1 hypothetical protein [Gammaproteobacteria bacterium]NIR91718.1 hypothetical protein [Gammaproteobacteria bacterium]NIU05916.1 hypothetical protein [Gammaproteobacteria bacterium]NIV52963.1 hypothetical protein [Gammaproteobacteria bacterium]